MNKTTKYEAVEMCFGRKKRGAFQRREVLPDVSGMSEVFRGPFNYNAEVQRYVQAGPERIEGQKRAHTPRLTSSDLTPTERDHDELYKYDTTGETIHIVATKEKAKELEANGLHPIIKRKNSLSKFNGMVELEWLWLDVDCAGDLAVARQAAQKYYRQLVELGVPECHILIRFSGSKGFHLLFPAAAIGLDLLGPMPVQMLAKTLQKIMPQMFEGIDGKVYLSTQLLRMPNTLNEKSGLFCIPIASQELLKLSIDEIQGLAKAPRSSEWLQEPDLTMVNPAPLLREQFLFHKTELLADEARYSKGNAAARLGGGVSVEQLTSWLDANHWPYEAPTPMDASRTMVKLGRCPRVEHHSSNDGDQGIFIIHDDGVLVFTCFHSGCTPPANPKNGRPDHGQLTKEAVDRISAERSVVLEIQPLTLAGADLTELADGLIQDLYIRDGHTILRHHRGSFYLYMGAGYIEVPDEDVEKEVMRWLRGKAPKRASVTTVRNLLAHVCAVGGIPADHQPHQWLDENHPNGDYLSVQNGILHIDGVIAGMPIDTCFHPHSPNFFAPVGTTYDFDPAAQCPEFIDTISRALPDEELRLLVQEFAGYTLTAGCGFQRFMVFFGEGGTMKSTIGELIAAMHGEAGVCSIPISKFGDRFSTWPLAHYHLNFVSEMPVAHGSGSVRIAEEKLKAIVTGDLIQVERKNKDAYSVRPTAKLLFLGNEMPHLYDRTEGLWRRMLIVPFEHIFPEDQKIADYAEKLAKREMNGILNWALEGLKRLHERGRFIEPEVCKILKQETRLAMDHETEYLLEHYEFNENALAAPGILIENMMCGYKNWCEANNYKPVGKNKLGTAVHRVFPEVPRNHREYVQISFGGPKRKLTTYPGVVPIGFAGADTFHHTQIRNPEHDLRIG